LNGKTKHIATNAFTHVLSRALKMSDVISKERMGMLRKFNNNGNPILIANKTYIFLSSKMVRT